jgi:hypothetical protein
VVTGADPVLSLRPTTTPGFTPAPAQIEK